MKSEISACARYNPTTEDNSAAMQRTRCDESPLYTLNAAPTSDVRAHRLQLVFAQLIIGDEQIGADETLFLSQQLVLTAKGIAHLFCTRQTVAKPGHRDI
jgi:hypothetical protein